MPGQQVTDARNDPAYWEQQLTHINPNIRGQAHANLARIQNERRQAVQQQQFASSHAQAAADRAARLEESKRVHSDAAGERQVKQQQLEEYRQGRLAQTEQGQRDRRSTGLLNMAQSPDLATLYGAQAPAMKKKLLNMYFESLQGGAPTVEGAPMGGGATSLDTLGGGETPNPRAAAVRNQLQANGEKVTPQTAPSPTDAPAGVPQRGNVAGAPQGGSEPSYPPGTYTSGSGTQMIGGSPAIPSNRLIQHGEIVGGPPGMDLNVNTGEFLPSDYEGTINGVPAGLSNAKSAAVLGLHSPESRSGQRAMQGIEAEAQNRQIGEATTPPMDVTVPEPPRMGGNQPHVAMNFGDITAPKTAGAPAATQPAEPAGPGNMSPWSLKPLLGEHLGGGIDARLGIGGAQPPTAPAPVVAGEPQQLPPMLPGAVPPEQSPAVRGLNAVRGLFGAPVPPPIVKKKQEDEG